MRERIKRVLGRARYAAIGAGIGAGIGGLVSRNGASTGGAIGGLVGAAVGETRANADTVIAEFRERRKEIPLSEK